MINIPQPEVIYSNNILRRVSNIMAIFLWKSVSKNDYDMVSFTHFTNEFDIVLLVFILVVENGI